MNKQQFLEKLKNRLDILSESEVKDIVDEYSDTIDQKVQEGMSEEDAVKDFGDINELADEILEAYKINTKRNKSKPEDTAAKVGNALNEIVEYLVKFFSSFFRDLSVEGVTRTLVLVGVAIVLIFVLQIPFHLIRTLLRSLLEVILPYGIGHALSIVTSIILSILFFILTVLIIISFVRVGVNGDEINAENLFKRPFREGFKFDDSTIKKDYKNSTYENSDQKKSTTTTTSKDEPIDAEVVGGESISNEKKVEEKKTEKENKYSYDYSYTYDKPKKEYKDTSHSFGQGIISAFVWILRFFGVCFLIPFWGILVGLGVAIGILIYLWMLGVPLFGMVLIVIGSMGFIGAIVNVFTRLIFSKNNRFWGIGVSLIFSALCIGIGIPLTIHDVTSLDPIYVSSEESTRYFGRNNIISEDIPFDKNFIYDFGTANVQIVVDKDIVDKVIIETYGTEFLDVDYYTRNDNTYKIYVRQEMESYRDFRDYVSVVIEAMKDKKMLVYDDSEVNLVVKVPYEQQSEFRYYDKNGTIQTLKEH